jgi:hypothetical protein
VIKNVIQMRVLAKIKAIVRAMINAIVEAKNEV